MAYSLSTVDNSAIEYSKSLLKNFERLAETAGTRHTELHRSVRGREPKIVPCVGQLLIENHNLVFNFNPGNHNAHAPGQRSFKQLITAWERAENGIEGDKYTYPEVLQLNEWAPCTLRCTCRMCSKGEAVELKCEPYPFGKRKGRINEVLVHKYKYNDDYKAVILGVSGDGRYRLWGPCCRDSLVTSYHDLISLEEIFPTGSGGREPQKPVSTSSTMQRPSFHRELSHRPSSGQATSSQAHDGSSEDISGSNVALSGEGQPSAPGIHASENSAIPASASAQVSESFVPMPAPLQKPAASSQHHAVPTNLAGDSSLAKSSLTPHQSVADVERLDLQRAYDNAEAHLATLEDGNGSSALETNKDLSKHIEWLESATVKKDERQFKIMWKRVNRDRGTLDSWSCRTYDPVLPVPRRECVREGESIGWRASGTIDTR